MQEKLAIGFIGNYQSGYVGEQADEVHLAREMEALGHQVFKIPRDEWREYVIEGCPEDKYPGVPKNTKLDIVIVAKWHHFYDGSFIEKAKELYGCPVFYWVWDFMPNPELPDWHIKMAQAADLYLSGEEGIKDQYKALGVKHYYFQFDVADDSIPYFVTSPSRIKYPVTFFGSKIPQGHRYDWIKQINKSIRLKIFAWNWEEWFEEGFNASPAVYGEEFNRAVSESAICLGFSVENNCWGYWSNRTGKTLLAGGFLLYEYTPGMELFLREGAAYFSSPEEAIQKINYYLSNEWQREQIRRKGSEIGRDNFSSKARITQLMILIDRFKKGDPTQWML